MGNKSRKKKERRLSEALVPENSQVKRNPQFITRIKGSISYEGPLPPPGFLKELEEIVPGSADRVIAMAERNQAHRQSLESAVIPRKAVNESRGQLFGFVLAVTIILAGTFLVYLDKDVMGLTLLLSDLFGFLGLFLYTDRQKRNELRRKDPRS